MTAVYVLAACTLLSSLLVLFLWLRLRAQHAVIDKQKAELREAGRQDALGTLAGGIAHDFNNILGSILGFGVLLEEDLTAHPELQGMAGQITSAARRGQNIVAQLMSYSRRNMEEDRHIKQPTALDDIIRESMNLLHPCIRRSTRMSYDNKTADSTIIGDATQISQAIVNLCINADHAIGVKTGTIDIALAEKHFDASIGGARPDIRGGEKTGDTVTIVNGAVNAGDYYALSVTDNGEGMTIDIARRIFEPFFTTKDVNTGTGLGLPALQGIVHGHGGAIIVTTTRFKGTSFELLFPKAA
jgi:signal transduction histidine kinase